MMSILIRTGDKFSKSFTMTEQKIIGFAKHSEDQNPIHLNEEYAKNSIFKKRIAHGFLVGSFISAVLGNDFPGNGTIYLSQTMKFKAPVFINDVITVELEVIDIPKENRVLLKTNCLNQDNQVVIEGEALIIPPIGTILQKL